MRVLALALGAPILLGACGDLLDWTPTFQGLDAADASQENIPNPVPAESFVEGGGLDATTRDAVGGPDDHAATVEAGDASALGDAPHDSTIDDGSPGPTTSDASDDQRIVDAGIDEADGIGEKGDGYPGPEEVGPVPGPAPPPDVGAPPRGESKDYVWRGLTTRVSSLFSVRRNYAEVFRHGSDGYLHHFYFADGWHEDQDAGLLAVRVAGDVSAVYSVAEARSDVFFQGEDGCLHLYYEQADGRWGHDADSFKAIGKILSLSAVYSPSRGHSEVFVIDQNRQLHLLYWDGRWEDDRGPGGYDRDGRIDSAGGELSAVYASMPGREHSEVYWVASTGKLHFSYFSNGAWQVDWNSFRLAEGLLPANETRQPAQIAAVYSDARKHSEVFVVSPEGTVHSFFVDLGNWAYTDNPFQHLTAREGLGAVYSPASGSSEVFVVGNDQRLHHYFVSDNLWRNEILLGAIKEDIAVVYAQQRRHSELFGWDANDRLVHSWVENGQWQTIDVLGL